MPDQAPPDTMLAAQADRVAFFDMVQTGFERAARAVGETKDLFIHLGGYRARLRFAVDGLVSILTPSLAHLAIEPVETPDLTIGLWDSTTTGAPLPLLIGNLTRHLEMYWFQRLDAWREIIEFSDERIRATFHPGPNVLCALDQQRNIGCYWVEGPSHYPHWEMSAPLAPLFSRWLVQRQRYYIHAAGMGTPAGGVLVAGKSGSGKSTTTLACLNSDLGILGDDYCLLADEPQPYAYSLYSIAKLVGDDDLARFPHLARWVSNRQRPPGEKVLIPLNECAPDRLLSGFPVKAVLVPRVTGGAETRVRPINPSAALLALAPTSLMQFAGGADTLGAMARLVKRVPTFLLELGTDLGRIPSAIQRLLGEL